MSLAATEFWFSPSVRRNRKSYILATLLLTAILILVGLALWFFGVQGTNGADIIFILFFIPAAICGYLLTAQRLRDMNLTGWLALLWIPVGVADKYVGGAASLAFVIVLCVVPGTKGDNKYGPDPLTM